MTVRLLRRAPLTMAAVALVLALFAAAPVRAARLEIVFKDGLWGMGIGALIGAAQVLMYEKNQDKELYRITTGAGIGVILGVAYGFFDAASPSYGSTDGGGAVAAYDAARHRLTLGLPALTLAEERDGSRRVAANLIQARF
jgi:hypothetical protein